MINRYQNGFTLIEVLVAIALLALIMVAVLTPMLGLFGVSRTSNDVLNANTLAQQRLEEARALVSANYSRPTEFNSKLNSLGVTCKNIGLYGNELQADCNDTTGVPPLRRLTVTVTQNKQTVTSVVDVQ